MAIVPASVSLSSIAESASTAAPASPKTISSLLAKYVKTVARETSAASAIWSIVVFVKPRSSNSCIAASRIAIRVACFLRSRRPAIASRV